MNTQLNQANLAYPSQTVERAKIALSCSPFRLKLFQDMRQQSVPIQQPLGLDDGTFTDAIWFSNSESAKLFQFLLEKRKSSDDSAIGRQLSDAADVCRVAYCMRAA